LDENRILPRFPLPRLSNFTFPMKQITPVFKREFLGYFRSPVAYVFLILFLLFSVGLAFSRFGQFFAAGVASLDRYFMFYPWLFLFLVPAVGMRLWSEEKRAGTVELLFTLPVTTLEAVTAKFLAAWAFLTLAILLSFPMAITIAYLGQPDWGVVVSTYLGAILMAGGYLGVCALTSALTKNQVISFVVSVGVCTVLVFLGYSGFTDTLEKWFPLPVADALANFSFITHFDAFTRGIIDPKDVIFFLSLTGFTLFLNVVAIER
jgi:ABC-2 type transport system permease protein